jgi:hypothetical protein
MNTMTNQEARDIVIEALIDDFVNSNHVAYQAPLREILDYGFQGYRHMLDHELVKEARDADLLESGTNATDVERLAKAISILDHFNPEGV